MASVTVTNTPKMSKFSVIIDNGHGRETLGKRSPDGRLLEWRWTRDAAGQLKAELEKHGIDARLLVPEDIDVPLSVRVERANAIAMTTPNCLLVSIHVNAASGKEWSDASGFSAWICYGASKFSECLALRLQETATSMGLSGNRWLPKEGFFRANFSIVKKTIMPAVLTENMFMTNADDVSFLLSEEGRKKIVSLHVTAIMEYLKSIKTPFE